MYLLETTKVALYIATHNITGLKYFGKTTRYFTDEEINGKYYGSGKYWKNHLKKHGKDITMKIIGVYDLDEVEPIAIAFSLKNNIVASTEWANLVLENGKTGGSFVEEFTNERRDKIRQKSIGRKGPQHTKEHIESLKEKLSGSNNYGALRINIYDNEGNLINECHGNFLKTCVDNGYPYASFQKSYTNNKFVYEDAKNNTLSFLRKQGNIKYFGWRCVLID